MVQPTANSSLDKLQTNVIIKVLCAQLRLATGSICCKYWALWKCNKLASLEDMIVQNYDDAAVHYALSNEN